MYSHISVLASSVRLNRGLPFPFEYSFELTIEFVISMAENPKRAKN
jgi:hypothetical protein